MLDHIEEAVALAKNRSRADLESDRVFFLALLKLVEIVGEAATRLSTCGLPACFATSPWPEQIGDPTIADGILDRLVHKRTGDAHRFCEIANPTE